MRDCDGRERGKSTKWRDDNRVDRINRSWCIETTRFLSSFIAAPTYGLKELEQERSAAKQWMENIRQKVKDKKVSFRSEVIDGVISAEATIVDYAESQNINLIVVGTRGRSGFSKVLLGSVASKVVTYAHCPVLVVKWLFDKLIPFPSEWILFPWYFRSQLKWMWF